MLTLSLSFSEILIAPQCDSSDNEQGNVSVHVVYILGDPEVVRRKGATKVFKHEWSRPLLPTQPSAPVSPK